MAANLLESAIYHGLPSWPLQWASTSASVAATSLHVLAVISCLLPGHLVVFTPTRVEEADHVLSKYSRLGISSPLLCSPCFSCFSKADRSWHIRVAVSSFSLLRLRRSVLGLSFLARVVLNWLFGRLRSVVGHPEAGKHSKVAGKKYT